MNFSESIEIKKRIKSNKDKALNSKNIKEINNYICFLLNYVNYKKIPLKFSYYEKIIKIVALSDEKTVNNFLNNRVFPFEENSRMEKEIILALITTIKKYNASIITLKLINFLFFKRESLGLLYKNEILNIIGEKKVETIVLESNKIENIYNFVYYVKGVITPDLEEMIIKSKDAMYIYLCARNIKNADISKLQDAVIETRNAKYIYSFAENVEGANISKLEDSIIETKNVEYIYEFVKNIKGTNIAKLEDAIIETRCPEYIYDFAKNIKGASIAKLEDAITKTRCSEYIYEFAKNIKGANISKLEDVLVNIWDRYYLVEFAKNIKGANISKLEDVIIRIGEPSNIYSFAKNIKGANIVKLEDAIIETRCPEYIYEFAENIKGANISKLENALVNTNDAKNIYCYARNIKGPNFEKFVETLFNLKSFTYVVDLLINKNSDLDILYEYSKKFMNIGEIAYSIELIKHYINLNKFECNEKNDEKDLNNIVIKVLHLMDFIDNNDIENYLLTIPVDKQMCFINNIFKLNDLKDCNTSHLKLINLSLIYYDVLPSVVKDFEEVKNNVELYLDLLKKCDEKKYYYYKNAFEGKISFEQADSYYKYYIDNLIDDKVDLWDDMENILKLKYTKNKKQKN